MLWKSHLCNYAAPMVSNFKVRKCELISGVSKIVDKAFLPPCSFCIMYISRLMVHAQLIEEEKVKEKSKETSRAKTSDGNFSHARSDGHGNLRFNKTFSGQGSSYAPPFLKKYRVSNPSPQRGNGSRLSFSLCTCVRC